MLVDGQNESVEVIARLLGELYTQGEIEVVQVDSTTVIYRV